MALTGPQVAAMLLAAGASPDQAVNFTGIIGRESHFDPTVHAGPPSMPRDDSYGLAQINMIGSLGPARRQAFGISSDAELYNPVTNIRATKIVSSGFTDMSAWTVPGGTWQTNVDFGSARNDVAQALAGNADMSTADTSQTPRTNTAPQTAGTDSGKFTLGPDIPGVGHLAELDKATVVKIGLCMLGGLIILVGLYVAFGEGATAERAKHASEHLAEEGAAA